jgi:uncharacterized SAM-binding protein YcdF (DUF218 family)
MWDLLSKTLPYLVYPLSLSLALMLAGVALARRRPRLGRAGVALAFLLLSAASSPPLARALYRSLEERHPPLEIDKLPTASVIVVLGGALRLPLPPRPDFEIGEAGNRARHAAALFRAGKAPRVLVSAGTFSALPPGIRPEAHYLQLFLAELGVPREAVLIESESGNTRENALASRRLLERHGLRSVLLVTSASHMPRALGAFRAAGIDAIPAPTDFQAVSDPNAYGVTDVMPSVEALYMTTRAVREYLGQAVYALRGWM